MRPGNAMVKQGRISVSQDIEWTICLNTFVSGPYVGGLFLANVSSPQIYFSPLTSVSHRMLSTFSSVHSSNLFWTRIHVLVHRRKGQRKSTEQAVPFKSNVRKLITRAVLFLCFRSSFLRSCLAAENCWPNKTEVNCILKEKVKRVGRRVFGLEIGRTNSTAPGKFHSALIQQLNYVNFSLFFFFTIDSMWIFPYSSSAHCPKKATDDLSS